MSAKALTIQDPTLQELYSSYQFVKSKLFGETGKAVVAAGAIINRVEGKNYKSINITEAPRYSIATYRKMVERIDVVGAIIERAAELVCETLSADTKAPSYIFAGKDNYDISPELQKNIEFTSQWMRHTAFRNKLYDVIHASLWAGNGYAEIVYPTDGEDGEVGEPTDVWKIPKIKPINPEEMRVARDPTGKVLGYIQYPFNVAMSGRNIFNDETMKSYLENGGIFFKPHEILHIKYNPFASDPYGNSVLEPLKDILAIIIGMREDLATIIKNFAAPLILFKLGTELIPASDAAIDRFKTNIIQQFNQSTNLITSSHVMAEIIDTGSKVMNFGPNLDQMMSLLHSSSGIAEVMLGRGDKSHEAAKVHMEVTSKKIRKMQWYIQEQVEMKIFPLLVGFKPDKDGNIILEPKDLNIIPQMYFGPIETEEDARIRYENGYQYGAISREEYRMRWGFAPKVMGTIIPTLDPEFIMKQKEMDVEVSKEKAAQANNGPNQSKPRDRNKTDGKEKGKKKITSA